MSVVVGAGRVDAARRRVDDALAHVEELGAPPLPKTSLLLARSFVQAADGLDAEAWADAHQAVALADHGGFALARLDALEWTAVLAARRGHAVTAARLLGATGAERDRIGYRQRIVPDLAELDDLIARLETDEPDAFAQGTATALDDIVAYVGRAGGERSRATAGWASLTPTERQVAGLVAQGLANAQIATTLLMSPATVKSHLTHAYAKLGIANRTELAALHLRRTAAGGGPASTGS
jgi:DNA-binding CsgD family transcriptional regulator